MKVPLKSGQLNAVSEILGLGEMGWGDEEEGVLRKRGRLVEIWMM